MESFWKWLMRANARGVFLAAMLGLLGVTAWWIWKENAPIEAYILPSSSRELKPTRPHLALLDYLKQQSALGRLALALNPFLSPLQRNMEQPNLPEFAMITPRNPQEHLLIRPGPPEEPRPALPAPPPPEPPEAMTPAPVEPPPDGAPGPSAVSLTYRGLLQRPDGRVMALIEDSESKTSAFYDVDKPVFGLRLGQIRQQEARVISAQGRVLTLRMGQPVLIEEPNRGR